MLYMLGIFYFYPYIINQDYRIRPIKSTVRVEVGKIFCRRGFVKHPYSNPPMSAAQEMADRWQLRSPSIYLLILAPGLDTWC